MSTPSKDWNVVWTVWSLINGKWRKDYLAQLNSELRLCDAQCHCGIPENKGNPKIAKAWVDSLDWKGWLWDLTWIEKQEEWLGIGERFGKPKIRRETMRGLLWTPPFSVELPLPHFIHPLICCCFFSMSSFLLQYPSHPLRLGDHLLKFCLLPWEVLAVSDLSVAHSWDSL